MGETATLLTRHIKGLEPDDILTTRECLPFGPRAVIDQFLYRQVKSGILIRLARGIFILSHRKKAKPSAQEIASIKAKAFGRRIAAHGSRLVDELNLAKRSADKTIVFSVDNSSSSFKYGDITIHFRKTSWRKMSLQQLKTGKAIGALWHLGKQLCTSGQVAKVTAEFSQRDKVTLRESAPWIPAWLSSYFLQFRLNHLRRQLLSV